MQKDVGHAGLGKSQMMKVRLEAFDHRILDRAVFDIISTANSTGASVVGPVPMPVKVKGFVVNRSTHVNKKSREKFEMRTHARVMIINLKSHTVDSLMKLDLPSGVDAKIKLLD